MIRKKLAWAIIPIMFLIPGHIRAEHDRRTPVVSTVEKAVRSVVNIRTEKVIKRERSPFFGFRDPFFEEFFERFSPPRYFKTESLGSGVIVDGQGHILTNAHVIEKASRIFAALPGRDDELEVSLVGMDEKIDLAILKIEGKGKFPYLPLGRSNDLMLGETVIAIGNPLGLGHSITTGIVSAPQRRIPVGNDHLSVFIQTDALINPGNSGGPLININGELIGINTAIVQQAQGIGFAIPIDTAKRVLKELIEQGRVRRPFIGIIPAPVGQKFAIARGRGGLLVDGVEPGSPADKAGLRYGDVIVSLNGEIVTSPQEFSSLAGTFPPGSHLTADLLRGAEKMKVEMVTATFPENYGLKYAHRIFGFTLKNNRQGVVISDVRNNSPAGKAGLRPGDFLVEVQGTKVESTVESARMFEEMIGREPIRFLIARGDRGYYLDLP